MTTSHVVERANDGGVEFPFYLGDSIFYTVRSRDKERLVVLPETAWCELYDRLSIQAKYGLSQSTRETVSIGNRLYLTGDIKDFPGNDLLMATFYHNRFELRLLTSSELSAYFDALVQAIA